MTEAIFGIAILILSVVVHEVSHGYMAERLGDPTARLAGRLTINPVSHLDPIGSILVPAVTWFAGGFIFGWAKPVPYNPHNLRGKWDEALVAAAGPVSNLLLAGVFGILIRLSVGGSITLPPAVVELSTFVVLINVVLMIFNLVPIPPLDGSKVLFAFLPYHYQRFRVMLERYGFVLILIFIFFLWGVITPLIEFVFTLLTGMTFF